jgi:ADP-dependent NAD(P)H-hydrate dehydratase / NAD(P)H-hydrate epimerase
LLAQGYTPDETAKIGVFLHGRAGDLVLEKESDESLIASDIIDTLGKAFRSIKSKPGIQKS